jgi:hypothetical protein
VRRPRWHRAAMTGLIDAAREVKEKVIFAFLDQTLITSELNRLMKIGP